MFEDRKQTNTAEAAAGATEQWEQQRAWLTEHIALAHDGRGSQDAPGPMLKTGEEVFAIVQDTALIEDRRGPGQWQGRSHCLRVKPEFRHTFVDGFATWLARPDCFDQLQDF